MPKISELFGGQGTGFLNASKLGGVKTYTIKSAESRTIKDQNKLVLSFGETPESLIVNRTNAKSLAKMYGDTTDAWVGKQVTLAAVDTIYQGQTVKGIRVISA